MAIQKRPYELSVWVEKLDGNNSKIEEKGVIIGAHDMSYPGKATKITLKREVKGTNTLTFQMPDVYFDSLQGEYVRNEFIDAISAETKLKLYYKKKWYEFFVKKIDEKKEFRSFIKTFTCTDAFIDELSRNGYGITYDTDLYNNVEEIGDFSEDTLEDSIWAYHPENNWGDFTEYKEEKLYKIPVSCFGGRIDAYKLDFGLSQKQNEFLENERGTNLITNAYTEEQRPAELSDDLSRCCFWDQYQEDDGPDNELTKNFITNIENDGYIYVPYSCLSFCYGSDKEPDWGETLKYDRAATETAISVNNKLILAPQSVDPRTIIQFYVIPRNAVLEIDEAGVILDKDYSYFMTLAQWNRMVSMDTDWWYIFEDTRLVEAQSLGSADVANPTISHTFKYLKDGENQILGTDFESRGNKCVIYDGYLSDVNNIGIIKGKKFSITDRTEINISDDIDQYTTVYNIHADDFKNEYTNEDWDYKTDSRTTSDEQYRVCSKIATRQVVPQLARNLVQNGTDMDSINGWSPMSYLVENKENIFTTPSVALRGVAEPDQENINTSVIMYTPSVAEVAKKFEVTTCVPKFYDGNIVEDFLNYLSFHFSGKTYYWGHAPNYAKNITWCPIKQIIEQVLLPAAIEAKETLNPYYIYLINGAFYYKGKLSDTSEEIGYLYICNKDDFFQKAITKTYSTPNGPMTLFTFTDVNEIEYAPAPDEDGNVTYTYKPGFWKEEDVWNEDAQTYDALFSITYTPEEGVSPSGNIADAGFSVINFGIVGQQKKIEKDKIYCLGVSAWTIDNFSIQIGKGSLIADGDYILTDEDNILDFSVGNSCDIEYNLQSNFPVNYSDLRKNITLSDSEYPTEKFILFKAKKDIENPYFIVTSQSSILLFKLYLFEAYTKGVDCFPSDESTYRYSGRDLFWPPKNGGTITEKDTCLVTSTYEKEDIRKLIIFEDDIMLGTTYGYQQYYIQRLKTYDGNKYDTMGKRNYISSNPKEIDGTHLPLDAADYTEDDYEIQTNYIDLNKCPFYNSEAQIDECDCQFGEGHTCFYQKFGYCPYRFKTEKHDRRIRTLSISKSNRFNIIQEISKVFEVYPQFWIDHKSNGTVVRDSDGEYLKKVFFITDKGRENKLGFRYEKNLKDISRNIASDQIVSKLYVLDVDSDLSRTGMCSIKTAEDNPSRDSYIIDLSYYVEKGMLDEYEVEQDLYGKTPNKDKELTGDTIPSGFLYQLGYYNKQYDDLSNKIINLQDASYTELEANLTVNYEGIHTAQEQILKVKKQINAYKAAYSDLSQYKNQQVYLNYLTKLSEQQSILVKLIYSTFYTDGVCDPDAFNDDTSCFDGRPSADANAIDFFNCIKDLEKTKEYWIDRHTYTKGILGQYNREYLQIQQWKRERASYLKLINQISSAFYKKYEPYLKEGTWSDGNYLTDNAYYFGALDVAAEGAIPKVQYTINVVDISPLDEEYEDNYDFDLADVTYVEDLGMFGINKHTGLPNRLKVLVSGITEDPDNPTNDQIQVQNFTTSFEDLFQQITASVQSLTFNENIYKRSSNFTSLQNIAKDSLQGTLDTNDLVLLDTDENNIKMDNAGTRGSDINNHANKYKLDGQGLYFSNDGGQHWSVGVGPAGINADYIKVGTLDAGKIRIVDGSYIYFAWDKDGIAAYRDPKGLTTNSDNINDAAIFNKYGLSILSHGHIKLRAGYSYTGGLGTPYTGNEDIGEEVGFYLYNSNNQVIFGTSTSTSENSEEMSRETAQLFLVGEMFVSNRTVTGSPGVRTYTNAVTATEIPYYIVYDYQISNSFCTYTVNGTVAIITSLASTVGMAIAYIRIAEPTITQVIHDTKTYDINSYSLGQEVFININGGNQIAAAVPGSITYTDLDDSSVYTQDFSKVAAANNAIVLIDSAISGSPSGTITALNRILHENSTSLDRSYSYDPAFIVENPDVEQSKNYYYYTKGIIDVYECDGVLFTDIVSQGGGQNVNGQIALYLNNKSDFGEEATTDTEISRLFVCCAGSQGEVRNIFSVLKDGSLYIGGIINNEDDPTMLSDKISIREAGIFIDKDGNLKMDFASILSPTGGSLPEYIVQQIKEEGRALQSLFNDMINSATAGLVTSGSSVYVPGEWVDWQDQTVTVNGTFWNSHVTLSQSRDITNEKIKIDLGGGDNFEFTYGELARAIRGGAWVPDRYGYV